MRLTKVFFSRTGEPLHLLKRFDYSRRQWRTHCGEWLGTWFGSRKGHRVDPEKVTMVCETCELARQRLLGIDSHDLFDPTVEAAAGGAENE